MKLNKLNILPFVASAAGVSEQLIKNYCSEDIYVTLYLNSTGATNGPFALPNANAWINDITGQGNTATISKSADVFTPLPKLVLGSSTDEGILYWSMTNVTGDPFVNELFAVTSAFTNGTAPNYCSNATTYGGLVHACQDANVTLTLSLCSEQE